MSPTSRWPLSPAQEEDVPALAALAARTLPTPWSASALAAELAAPESCLLVARAGVGPAGFLLARRVVDELHVLLLAVEPSWRRRGIASALVARALAEGRAAGARSALLEVRAGNQPARALYAGQGFHEVGRRRRYYAGGEDAVLLTCELETGSAVRGAP